MAFEPFRLFEAVGAVKRLSPEPAADLVASVSAF